MKTKVINLYKESGVGYRSDYVYIGSPKLKLFSDKFDVHTSIQL